MSLATKRRFGFIVASAFCCVCCYAGASGASVLPTEKVDVCVITPKKAPIEPYIPLVAAVIAVIGVAGTGWFSYINMKEQISSSEHNTKDVIEAKFREIDTQYRNTLQTKTDEDNWRRRSRIGGITVHTLLIRNRSLLYRDDLNYMKDLPITMVNKNNIGRMTITLHPVFDADYHDMFLVGDAQIYADIVLLRNAIGRANRRITELTEQLKQYNTEELKYSLVDLSDHYQICINISEGLIDKIKRCFGDGEVFVAAVRAYFDKLQAQPSGRDGSVTRPRKAGGVPEPLDRGLAAESVATTGAGSTLNPEHVV